jgi:hypothetical protein
VTLQSLNLPADKFQYNEDLALNATRAILFSPELLSSVIAESYQQGIKVSEADLINNTTVERKHAFWELRFRHSNPAISLGITNLWANKAYETMLSWSRSGKVPGYVIFAPPALATLSLTPVTYGRNQLVLAGFILGFIAGILVAEVLIIIRR